MKKGKIDKTHIIPFPLPEYLADFISNQLRTPLQIVDDHTRVKAMHISRRSSFGKMILRCLEKSDKEIFVRKGLTIFITVSQYNRIHSKKLVEARGTFLKLSDESVLEIQEVFKDYFEAVLVSFVDGAHFGNNYKKGKRDAAIRKFIKTYGIREEKSMFDRLKRMYYREKSANHRHNSKIHRML